MKKITYLENKLPLSSKTLKNNEIKKSVDSIEDQKTQIEKKYNSLIEEWELKEGIRRAEEDPFFFLTHYCYTLDQHDQENPVKLLPPFDYIKFFSEQFLKYKLILVEKSRQMIVTWTFVALCLWDTMVHKGKLTFFQSKKEEDANALVDRAKFIYNHLPLSIKDKYPVKRPFTYMKLIFPTQFSEIRATPQGPDQIRMHTSSNIMSDEFAFQEEARNAYTAAKPTIDGGGRFIGVSSVNGKNFFYKLSHDLEGVWDE